MAVNSSTPILIVDDYNTMIRIIRNLLRQLGFEQIDEANDGSSALAKMRSRQYGLVISDWNMEPMTGYDLLQVVRNDPELADDAVHHGDGGIEDRERDRGQEGRRVQLYRQAVQRADAEEQDRRGVRRKAFAARLISPRQFAHHRLRHLAGGGEGGAERLAVGPLAPAQFLGVDA